MTNRYLLIVNPISGRGSGEKSIPRLNQLFKSTNLQYDLKVTERPGHGITLARQAVSDGYDFVVAVGGDGTANEVLNGLMLAKEDRRSDIAMGIIAIGRGNDCAYGMHIPPGLEAGFNNLLNGYRQLIDVGLVRGGDYPEGRYFGNGIGIGFDAVVGFEALKITWLSGFPSYIVAVLKTVFIYFHAPTLRIETDIQSMEMPSLMVSIMNGRRMGGGFLMAPMASNDDGLLDLCIAEGVSRMRIFTLIPHFLRGSQDTQHEIHTLKAARIVVTALVGKLPVHADGETICVAGDRLEIDILPHQIGVICTQEAAV
jgi:diacylglycerol kinase (ATP)